MLKHLFGAALILALPASSAIAPDPNMIRMTADKQSYNLDQKKYVLSGKVTVAYQDIRITGSKAVIDMNEAGKPEVAHFTDRPLFKQIKPSHAPSTFSAPTP